MGDKSSGRKQLTHRQRDNARVRKSLRRELHQQIFLDQRGSMREKHLRELYPIWFILFIWFLAIVGITTSFTWWLV